MGVAFVLWSATGVVMLCAAVLVVRRVRRNAVADGGVDLGAVERFLAGRRIAVVGASTDRRKFGNTIFRELRTHGYDAVPVNPSAPEVEGVRCYADLAAVPDPIDGVMVMVGGDAAVAAVHAAADRGVSRVWLFRGLGAPGALSDASLAACRERGLDVVAGACPLMFLEPVAAFHDVHRALRRFNGAFTDAA